MDSGIGESMGPYHSGDYSNDTGDFECNICFELAQDPIVTLCGHLYCWPCLYRWLHIHSHCRECPVCKALIQEERLVPLYGRGKTSSDPRSRSVPGAEIPHRPAGQRPETAPPPAPNANYFRQDGIGLMGGFMPTANARIRNSTFSAAFGGLMQSLNLHVHGFHDATVYGATTGFPFMFSSSFHGGHVHGFHHHSNGGRRINSLLKMWFLFVGLIAVFALIT